MHKVEMFSNSHFWCTWAMSWLVATVKPPRALSIPTPFLGVEARIHLWFPLSTWLIWESQKHHEVVPQPTILDLQFALICYDLLKSLDISKWHIHIAAAGHTCLSNLQLVRPIRHPDIPWNPPTCSAKTPAVQWKPEAKLTGQPTRIFRSQPTPRHSGQAKMRILGKQMVKLGPIWAQRNQATRAAFGVWKKIGGLMLDELTKHFSIRLQKIANPESITRIYKGEKQQSCENPNINNSFQQRHFAQPDSLGIKIDRQVTAQVSTPKRFSVWGYLDAVVPWCKPRPPRSLAARLLPLDSGLAAGACWPESQRPRHCNPVGTLSTM